jgi:anti-sigma B factor antagonist
MEIEKYMRGGVTVLALDGELDSSTASDVRERLGELVPGEGRVLLDLSRTTYMSSAGLRVLLLLYRQVRASGVRLALAGITDDVTEVMAATGFLAFFTVAGTVEDGVAALGDRVVGE